MGHGLLRAKAIAINSRLSEGDHNFLRLLREWDGVATSQDLGPQTSQDQNRARQRCKRNGLVTFEGGYWRMTDLGRHVVREI